MEEILSKIFLKLDHMDEEIKEIKSEMTLKSDIDVIKSEMALKSGIKELKAAIDSMHMYCKY